MAARMVLVSTLLMALVLAAGCVTVKEPLVRVNSSEFAGGTHPDTQVQSTDTDEVRALKTEVVRLQRDLADTREDLAREKAKRKAAEDKLKRLKGD